MDVPVCVVEVLWGVVVVVWVSVFVTVVVWVTVFVSLSVVEGVLAVGELVSEGWVSIEVCLLVVEGVPGPPMQPLMNTIPMIIIARISLLPITYPPVQATEKSPHGLNCFNLCRNST